MGVEDDLRLRPLINASRTLTRIDGSRIATERARESHMSRHAVLTDADRASSMSSTEQDQIPGA